MEIGEQIRSSRIQKKRTIASVARGSGLTLPTVRAVENGRASLASMFKVLDELGNQIIIGREISDDVGKVVARLRTQQGFAQRVLAS